MSFNSCLQSLGVDQFAEEDVLEVQARFAEHIRTGKAEPQAAQQALRDVIDSLGAKAKGFNQFAGVTAATADTVQLTEAMMQLEDGAHPERVRQDTGWFKGADGKWRFEISDADAELIRPLGELATDPRRPAELRLGDVLNHPRLYAAYPKAADIKVSIGARTGGSSAAGWFNARTNTLGVSAKVEDGDPVGTILHELQHWIQRQEQYALGGSADFAAMLASGAKDLEALVREVTPKLLELRERLAGIRPLLEFAEPHIRVLEDFWFARRAADGEITPDVVAAEAAVAKAVVGGSSIEDLPVADLIRVLEIVDVERDFFSDRRNLQDVELTLQRLKEPSKQRQGIREAIALLGMHFEAYRRLAGEVEARNTETRRKLSDGDRQLLSPEMTQDVPTDEVIVVMNGKDIGTRQMSQSASEPEQVLGDTTDLLSKILVRLGDKSNESTMLHELAHVFLVMEGRVAEKYGTDEQAEKILEVLGVESFADVKTEQHELFARTFEAYLLDGKAPSLRLREAFAAFSRWLARVYAGARKTWLTSQGVKLTPEVKSMFDRLLASQAEIDAMALAPEFAQLFRSQAQAGMTDAEWKRYSKLVSKRNDRAQVTLEDKLLKVVRALRTAEWNEELKPLVDEEIVKLRDAPVYKAIASLSEFKLDAKAVAAALGVNSVPAGRLLSLSRADGVVDPAQLAEAHGFISDRSLLEHLQSAPTIKAAATEAATKRLTARYGDVLNDGSIEAEAEAAFHNDLQAELLMSELRALRRRAKGQTTPEIPAKALAAAAKSAVEGMVLRDITPTRFHRAEVRAAKATVSASTPQDAALAKAQQLSNHHLYRATLAAKSEIAKISRYVAKRQRQTHDVRDVPADYAAAIQQIARMYGTSNAKQRDAAAQQITAWFESQLRDRTDFAVTDPLLAEVLARRAVERQAGRTPTQVYSPPLLNQLTLAQARGVYEQLRHLRHLGGVESDTQQEVWADDREALKATLPKIAATPQAGAHVGKHQHLIDGVRVSGNDMLSLRNLIRKLDGQLDWHSSDGAWYSKVFARLLDAQSAKRKLEREVNEQLDAELKALHKLTMSKGARTLTEFATESGRPWPLDEEERVILAFYWGEEYNRKAVMTGFGVTEKDVTAVLSTLTQDQAALVNAMWAANERLWPQLATANHDVYGYVPTKTVALPFTVGGMRFTGGHASLVYQNTPAAVDYLEGETASFFSRSLAPTQASAMRDRVGSGKRAVLLSKNNFFRTLNDNIHFISFAKTGLELQQLVGNKGTQTAVSQSLGAPFLTALNKNIQGITTNRKERDANDTLATISRVLRRAASMRALGYSIRNSVQQLTSIPIIAQDLGPGAYAKAVLNMYGSGDLKVKKDFIHERSEMMRSRSKLVNRESAEILREIGMPLGKLGRAWHWYQKHAFTLQSAIDMTLAYPAWQAKYEQEVGAHGDGDRARRAADVFVGETIGSGDDLFLSNLYRSNRSEAIKTVTAMGSWSNLYLNRVYRSTKGGRQLVSAESLVTAFLTPVLIATLSATVVWDGPDDDESWGAWVASNFANFGMSWLPLLRDLTGFLKFRRPPDAGYGPAVAVLGDGIELVDDILDPNEQVEFKLKSVVDTVSSVVPIGGAGLVSRVADYVDSYAEGKEGETFNPYQAVVEGSDKDD